MQVLGEVMFDVHITSVIAHYGMQNRVSWMILLDVDTFSVRFLVTPWLKVRQTPETHC